MCECDRLCGLLVSAAASQPSVMGSNLTQLKGNQVKCNVCKVIL